MTTTAFAIMLRRRVAFDRAARREERQLSLSRERCRRNITVIFRYATQSRPNVGMVHLVDTTAGGIRHVGRAVVVSISSTFNVRGVPTALWLDVLSLVLSGIESPETVGLVVTLLRDPLARRGERSPESGVD